MAMKGTSSLRQSTRGPRERAAAATRRRRGARPGGSVPRREGQFQPHGRWVRIAAASSHEGDAIDAPGESARDKFSLAGCQARVSRSSRALAAAGQAPTPTLLCRVYIEAAKSLESRRGRRPGPRQHNGWIECRSRGQDRCWPEWAAAQIGAGARLRKP
jgi:hypothetical protein